MIRPLLAVRDFWIRRTLRLRIALTSAAVALASLLVVAWFTPTLIAWLLVDSADTQLHASLDGALPLVRHGATRLPDSAGMRLRVLDTEGAPVDGGVRPWLDEGD
ncbi:MAG: two-component sensor histidine kinase, partial [Sciscionella sp.]